jgi:hypothetical protein
MKRSSFLLIAAVIPLLFGLVMMVVPDTMLSNSLTSDADLQTRSVTQWVGFGVFTIGLINFLSRNDGGSTSLKAIIIGNIVFHTLGLFFDIYHYSIGVMRLAGLLTGLAPHSFLIIGFVYYLRKLPQPADQ